MSDVAEISDEEERVLDVEVGLDSDTVAEI